MVEKCFERIQQMILAAAPRQALHQPEVTGHGAQRQSALEMRQAGVPETLPRLQRVGIETRGRQLNAQQQLIFMTMQAQLIAVFMQTRLLSMAIQAVNQRLEPTARRCW